MNIGLTGGIATGKSTVSAMLVERGAILIDADQIAREVVLPGTPVLFEVAERFGQAVLFENGELNRKRLGEIIFNDEQARRDLGAILHPPIRSIMVERMRSYEEDEPERLVVVDVPLLFESKLEHMFSSVMLVYIPEALQLTRLMERDKLDREQASARLASQMPIDKKRERADIIIDNSSTLQYTEAQIDRFWNGKKLR